MTTATDNTPAVRRAPNPNQAPGQMATLHTLLQSRSNNIAEVLPKHLTPDKMIKLVMIAANKTPKLLQCSGMTILESVMRAAELGLNISGTMGEAYLVPYGKDCQLIPGYKGLVKLARQSGEIRRIEAEVVCENDHFIFQQGTEFKLEFRKATGDRGQPIRAYALAEYRDGGFQAIDMTADEIESIRRGSKAGNSGPWVTHPDEMWKKTAFRRLSKWLPMSSDKFQRAAELADAEYTISEPHRQSESNAAGLNAAIEQAAAQNDEQPQGEPDVIDEQQEEPAPQDWTAAVDALKAKTNCDTDTAEEAISDAVTRQYKKEVSELTPKQIEAVIKAIEDGKITAPE